MTIALIVYLILQAVTFGIVGIEFYQDVIR
jgi:hypothetical protein